MGVVIDPQALFKEIDDLARMGVTVDGRLIGSEKAHVILPCHREFDVLGSQARRTQDWHDLPGYRPAYEDKIGRRGIRICDLLGDREALAPKCAKTSVRGTASSRTPRSIGIRCTSNWWFSASGFAHGSRTCRWCWRR